MAKWRVSEGAGKGSSRQRRSVDSVIDGHNDLAWAMRKLCDYDLDQIDLRGNTPALHTDIPRLRAGVVTGQFWSVYVSSTLAGAEAVTATLEQIDFVHRLVARHPDVFQLTTTADGIQRARTSGRIASLIGMEGGHSIDQSLAVLRMMYELGARYLTLTHNHNIEWADSGTDTARLGGLSSFGVDVVREMNRLGMLVDLSHTSDDVMRQAIDVSSAPVIFSHSSARAVCDGPRNVPDDVLSSLAVNGGLCMVTFVANFVSPEVAAWVQATRETLITDGQDPHSPSGLATAIELRSESENVPVATIDDVAEHFDHIREVAGIDHVGIGGDFDGATLMPDGLDDVSGYPRLFDALTSRGWSRNDLDKVSYANILRVLGDAEAVSDAT
jgi:membrane dipeptidase